MTVDGGPVLVLTALPEEARPLRRAFRGRDDVVVAVTGDGAERAREATGRLLAHVRPRAVIVAGLAGALTRYARPGEVRLIREVRDGAGRVRRPEAALLERVRGVGLPEDVLVSIDTLARTAEERDRTRRIAGIDSPGTGLVDLETAACVDTAELCGVPWLAVRAVSDGPDDHLPRWLEDARDGRGSVSRVAVAAGALMRPKRIPALIALARRARSGARALAQYVPSIVAAGMTAAESEQRLSGDRA